MRARTSFFDENPSGRLINRLVRDFDQVRSVGIISIADTTGALIDLLSIWLLTAFANPWVAGLMLPLLWVFFTLQNQRAPLVSQARACTASLSSRVLDRQTDLIGGRNTYLLYGQFHRLVQRLADSFEAYARSVMVTVQIETWFTLWIRMSTELYILAVMVALAWGLAYGKIDPATAGVIISALFAVNGSINFLDMTSGQMARQMAHAGRIFEYIDLPPEQSQEQAKPRPDSQTSQHASQRANFPGPSPLANAAHGALSLQHLNIGYRADSPVILHDFSLDIQASSKVALIGRTGCGKTSVIQALLHLMYVHRGEILL